MSDTNLNLNYIVNALWPVVQEYLKERTQLEELIVREGKVPSCATIARRKAS